MTTSDDVLETRSPFPESAATAKQAGGRLVALRDDCDRGAVNGEVAVPVEVRKTRVRQAHDSRALAGPE
jgi:hypothetical protein